MIPKRRGRLVVGVVTRIGGAHRSGAAVESNPGVGITVAVRHDPGAVNVRHRADLRHILAGAVNGVVERQKMFFGKLVPPLHPIRLALARFEGRSRPHAVVSPHDGGREIAVRPMAERAHPNPD